MEAELSHTLLHCCVKKKTAICFFSFEQFWQRFGRWRPKCRPAAQDQTLKCSQNLRCKEEIHPYVQKKKSCRTCTYLMENKESFCVRSHRPKHYICVGTVCWHAVQRSAFVAWGVFGGSPRQTSTSKRAAASERAGVQRHSWHESRQRSSLAAFSCRVYENNLLVISRLPRVVTFFSFFTQHLQVAGATAVGKTLCLKMFSPISSVFFLFFS